MLLRLLPVRLVLGLAFSCASANVFAQAASTTAAPIIQPGAPGTPNKTLTAATAAAPPRIPSDADVKFMQGMIMHHGQAVEMTALIESHTKDPAVRSIGSRIKLSQTDEMRYMKRWLTDRGEPLSAPMPGMDMPGMDMGGMDMKGMDMPAMPGMLTQAQMKALRAASGPTFDHLFLTGMIQHHTGALTMVKDLFSNQGAGQDPQLFDFASDVDNTQQAEIDIMHHMLKEKQ